MTSCPASCTWSSAGTTSATSSRWPRSTWTRRRSARTWARRSTPDSTTPSASPRSARSASPCSGVRPSTAWARTTARSSRSRRPSRSTWPQALREAEADVLVSYLPVGSEQAQRHYAQACLDAGVAFVNAIPVFIASDPEWARKFRDAGVPIVGDDIKSQVGSTIVHRILTRLFEDRGVALDQTYQLNFGGNMDFKNMLERERLESKKISKTQAVTSQLEDNVLDADDVHVGPSDHVPWLKDRKWAYIRMEGRNFGDVPLNLELKLEVWDSPNSAGVIIDAVRCAKLALDRGIGGPLLGPSAYFMKSPPVQYHDDVAHATGQAFAAGEAQESWPTETDRARVTGHRRADSGSIRSVAGQQPAPMLPPGPAPDARDADHRQACGPCRGTCRSRW